MKAKSLQIKIRSGYNWIESQGNKRSVQWLTWGIYTLIIIVFALRHEPGYDEYHAWGMLNQMDFVQLWKAMRIEGHFVLWHLCLWPFVKWFGMDWHSLYCVSVPLMSLAAWLLLFKVRFPFVGKLLVVCSAPFFYYYPVIARCYALIPPILMGLVTLYQQKKYPVLYCMLLGLLANTHAYIEGLVGLLWCLFVYKEVFQKWKTQPHEAKRNILASMLTVVLVVFALMQVIGGLVDVSQGNEPIGEGKNTPEYWLQIFYGGYHVLFFDWLHSHVSALVLKLDLLMTLSCYAILVIYLYHSVRSSVGTGARFLMLFCGIGWQVMFAINLYGMNWQRIGLLYFVVVFVLLLCGQTQHKPMLVSLFVLWVLNTPSNYRIVKDLWIPFSQEIIVAKEVESWLPDNSVFYVNTVEIKDLFSVPYEKWGEREIGDIETENMDLWIFSYADGLELHDCVAISSKQFESQGCTVELVYTDGIHQLLHILR